MAVLAVALNRIYFLGNAASSFLHHMIVSVLKKNNLVHDFVCLSTHTSFLHLKHASKACSNLLAPALVGRSLHVSGAESDGMVQFHN